MKIQDLILSEAGFTGFKDLQDYGFYTDAEEIRRNTLSKTPSKTPYGETK